MSAVQKAVTLSTVRRLLLEAQGRNALNSNAFLVPANKVLAWKDDGTITLADCTVPALRDIAGISYQPIPSGQYGLVIQTGPVPGALTGLGAIAGQPVYLGVVAGSLTLVPPSGVNVEVIRIGYAEPADNDTGEATTLRLELAASGGGGGGVTVDTVESLIAAQVIQQSVNDSGNTIPNHRAVVWTPAGTVEPLDVNAYVQPSFAGVTVEPIADGVSGAVRQSGRAEGALIGLGAFAGNPIYVSEATPGLLSTSPPSSPSAAIVRVGFAQPPDGTGGAATDLVIDFEAISVP